MCGYSNIQTYGQLTFIVTTSLIELRELGIELTYLCVFGALAKNIHIYL